MDCCLVLLLDVHDFVQLGGQDNIGTAVAGLAFVGVVAGDGDVLAAPRGGDALGRDLVFDQLLNDGQGAFGTQLPVEFVFAVAVGMAFDQDIDLLVALQDLRQFCDGLGPFAVQFGAAPAKTCRTSRTSSMNHRCTSGKGS